MSEQLLIVAVVLLTVIAGYAAAQVSRMLHVQERVERQVRRYAEAQKLTVTAVTELTKQLGASADKQLDTLKSIEKGLFAIDNQQIAPLPPGMYTQGEGTGNIAPIVPMLPNSKLPGMK